ncbi:MAG: UvrD-helicase domain-containing protein [Nitrospirae bacterium]|nr:UvrD-helicase domain-containing protein [Nitrospirota bacterium]
MADPVLIKDSEIHFPHFTVVKASAGSGKTHALTGRFVQFLLSEKIRKNGLRNIMAITFSNNAAREMRERVLSWLKEVCLEDPGRIEELSGIVSLDRAVMGPKAGLLVDEILEHYADFQVRTIDSFMASVFKSSAIDFGYNPDFEILLDNSALMEYAFNIFLRNVREGSAEAGQLEKIVDSLSEYKKTGDSYLWDPSASLLDEIKKIHSKIASTGKTPKTEDLTTEIRSVMEGITAAVEEIEEEIVRSGLKRHGASSYKTVYPIVKEKRFPDLIGKTFANLPVTRPSKGQPGSDGPYARISGLWEEAAGLINRYSVLYARNRCVPYLRAYGAFSHTVEKVKRQLGRIFIEDIGRHLSEYLGSSIVPDIYFRIGDTVYHFLIDEFQDTSPIQWSNLFPLIENSLSQGGSLFVVGDTKQAIYGFRDADYTIMKGLEHQNPFPSADHDVKELDTNYRSKKKILSFAEMVFKEAVASNDEFREAGRRSGLTDYIQRARVEEGDDGYAEVVLCNRDDKDPPEKAVLRDIILDLHKRGYDFRDIAVLTQKNEDAVRVTTWLNESNVHFISYSSLDVRRRKITGEVVALLNFLDAPTDDFSFASFILGEIFLRAVEKDPPFVGATEMREFCFIKRDCPPLYKAFQEKFPQLWRRYFEGLFRSSAFFPLYDLVTEVCAVFEVFRTMKDEEATVVKIFEAVKDFEGEGFNSLRDFLETAADDEAGASKWNMEVPKNTDAVRVMTIHKAKGLGFPVAVVLLYGAANRGFDYIIEEDRKCLTFLKLNKAVAACDPLLNELYCAEQMKEKVNRLNTLYVGLTRPENELYVIGVKGKEKGYPFDLLPVTGFAPSAKPQIVRKAASSEISPATDHLHLGGRIAVPEPGRRSISFPERRRGEFIHRVLFFIDYFDEGLRAGIADMARRAAEEIGQDYTPADIEKIMAIVSKGGAAEYFRELPGRRVLREQEFSDRNGRLLRMDRVVVDRDRVTVLDFKTGPNKEGEEKYRSQMNSYMEVLRDLHPELAIEGILAFVDLGEIVRLR